MEVDETKQVARSAGGEQGEIEAAPEAGVGCAVAVHGGHPMGWLFRSGGAAPAAGRPATAVQ